MKKLAALLIAAALVGPAFAAETKKPEPKKAEKAETKKVEPKKEEKKEEKKPETVKEKLQKKFNTRQPAAALAVRG
jgi:hypothetical protein